MKVQRIYLCENSIEGIFTAIYQAWSSRYGHANIKIQEKNDMGLYSNFELFSEYFMVETDLTLVTKVSRSIKEKISDEAYQMVYRVGISNYKGKADLIYRFLIFGFSVGPKILGHLSNEIVGQIYKINRYVSNEVHHMHGFIRFSEQENRILVSVIHPKNNILALIAPHFADRLPEERFIIIDGNRKIAVLHLPGKSWVLIGLPNYSEASYYQYSSKEEEYQDLWKAFFENIAIKERTNFNLQRNNLPLRFRKDMTEFQS
ncbi:MAG: DNA metabolism protein [Clostridiales bacterium]|nr:DNA metabolism protein [Clostridiales bacterium]